MFFLFPVVVAAGVVGVVTVVAIVLDGVCGVVLVVAAVVVVDFCAPYP